MKRFCYRCQEYAECQKNPQPINCDRCKCIVGEEKDPLSEAIKEKKNMSQEITIVVDENDADYLTKVSEIFDEELAAIMPLIKAIKKFKPYKWKDPEDSAFNYAHTHERNYPTGEMIREDLGEKPPRELYKFDEEIFDVFENFLPDPEHGFHDIVSIEICPKVKKTRLL